jgi:5-methylcytosine-specific restriction protein A
VTFPIYKEIEIPLILHIYNQGGKLKASDCYKPLADYFELSETDRNLLLDDGTTRSSWNNRVQWTRNALVKNRYLLNASTAGRGIWQISDRGETKASQLTKKVDVSYPDDVPETFFEGAKKQIFVCIYERNKNARDKCIDHYGCLCAVCEIDFEKTYGDLGKDFIHVHHIVAISDIGKEYELDPINDLRPICPNCHSMAHRRNPALSIDDLRLIIQRNREI